ncbi:unnamed protein product [Ixodes pacificus]
MAHDHHGHGGMHDPVNATSGPMVTTPLQAILTAVLASTAATAPAHHLAPGTQSPHTDGHGHMNAHDSSVGGMHDMVGAPQCAITFGAHMMYFHFGLTETVLFKNWAVNSVGGMVGSVVGIFIMAAMYEGLKYFREHLFRLHFSSMHYSSVAVTGQDGRTLTEVHQIARWGCLPRVTDGSQTSFYRSTVDEVTALANENAEERISKKKKSVNVMSHISFISWWEL